MRCFGTIQLFWTSLFLTLLLEVTAFSACSSLFTRPLSFNRFTQTEWIREEGRFQIYRAWDSQLMKRVVIKVVGPQSAKDPRFAEKELEQEYEFLRHIDSSGWVRTHGMFKAGEQKGLILEEIRGRSLLDVVNDGDSHLVTLDGFQKMTRALLEQSEQRHLRISDEEGGPGFHGDMSLKNVMVREDGSSHWVILDPAFRDPKTGVAEWTPLFNVLRIHGEKGDVMAIASMIYKVMTTDVPLTPSLYRSFQDHPRLWPMPGGSKPSESGWKSYLEIARGEYVPLDLVPGPLQSGLDPIVQRALFEREYGLKELDADLTALANEIGSEAF